YFTPACGRLHCVPQRRVPEWPQTEPFLRRPPRGGAPHPEGERPVQPWPDLAKRLELDNRGLEPPEPMARILAALKDLPARGYLPPGPQRPGANVPLPEAEGSGVRVPCRGPARRLVPYRHPKAPPERGSPMILPTEVPSNRTAATASRYIQTGLLFLLGGAAVILLHLPELMAAPRRDPVSLVLAHLFFLGLGTLSTFGVLGQMIQVITGQPIEAGHHKETAYALLVPGILVQT